MIYALKMFSDFVEGKGTNDRHREESTKLNVYTTYRKKTNQFIFSMPIHQSFCSPFQEWKKQTNKTLKKQKREIRGNRW